MPEQQSNLPKLLTRIDLRDLGICYCNVHLLRLERDGKFPKRIYLSPYKVAWIKDEVVDWLTDKVQERET